MDLSKINRGDIKVIDDDLDSVLSETIADYETRAEKTLQPASIERLLINTHAYRETLARQQVNEVYRQNHPRFATGVMLDICGDDVATPRLSSTPALTTLRFSAPTLTGETLISVPIGTRAQVGELIFINTVAGVLKAGQTIIRLPAECATAGSIGNGWSVGQISILSDKLHDTIPVTVSNITETSGGVDDELDDAYRERVLLAPESFSIGGTIGAYKYFAREYSSAICDVETVNDKDADGKDIGGTVVLYILTQTGLPSGELLAGLTNYFKAEDRRILCDKVSPRAPQTVHYAIDAELTLLAGANEADVLDDAKAAWASYESARRLKLGGDIVPLDVQTVLKVAGVYNVKLNNVDLIVLNRTQWARCAGVTITVAEVQQDG